MTLESREKRSPFPDRCSVRPPAWSLVEDLSSPLRDTVHQVSGGRSCFWYSRLEITVLIMIGGDDRLHLGPWVGTLSGLPHTSLPAYLQREGRVGSWAQSEITPVLCF